MLKKILAILALLYAAASFAAVDVNTATAADLDSVKGIGPVMSKRILEERKKGGQFKNWDSLMARVKGIAPITAARLSYGGLRVNGEEYHRELGGKPVMQDEKKAATPEKKEAKAVAKSDKKEDKAAAAKPAASKK